MLHLQTFLVWAALSGAVFPSFVSAGEWEEYLALKAAMVRSTAKTTPLLPNWIVAQNFEPRPHYWLDEKKHFRQFPQEQFNPPQLSLTPPFPQIVPPKISNKKDEK